MSDYKLYEVECSVKFYIEIEALDADEAKDKAEQHLVERGVFDLTACTSPIEVVDVRTVVEEK